MSAGIKDTPWEGPFLSHIRIGMAIIILMAALILGFVLREVAKRPAAGVAPAAAEGL